MVVQGEGDLGRRDFFDLFSDWGVKNYRTDNITGKFNDHCMDNHII